jgi:membrane protease subunit (stomatin/prohibitin family)
MGLIKAITGGIGSTFSDQFIDFFYCESMPATLLVTKGKKRKGPKSQNKGDDNIIANGSGIAVADGQCMIIVEQGRVVELCAEPGEFKWDNSSSPSVFSGSLGTSIMDTFKTMGSRIARGGDTGKDQRVYYINVKELMDNKFGTSTPVPYRVVDTNIGLDMDISIRCNGVYSYRISDPLLFYTNVSGNVEQDFTRDRLDGQLKSEFLASLQPAFARISSLGIRYSALPGHTLELADAINKCLSGRWAETRGLTLVNISINSVSASKEDEDLIKQLQRTAVMRNTDMAAATLVGAQADAMRAAADNKGGAMMGFMGMGMAQQAGGMNAQNLFAMNQQQSAQQPAPPPPPPMPAEPPQPAAPTWNCAACGCGKNTGRFCAECGQAKPVEDTWVCCGVTNKGRFCQECGKPRPAPVVACSKCGFKPEGASPRFCPECGGQF